MYKLHYTDKVPLKLGECWDFFSSPRNLKKLTPDYLDFQMLFDPDSERMYPGQIIAYTIKPVLHVPITWVTEITQVKELEYFIDEQRFGPYKFWHHEHRFREVAGGVEVTDIIYYKMPYGVLGRGLHALKVHRDLKGIFSYRASKMKELFGACSE